MNLTTIYRVFHSAAAQYTIFSAVHEMSSKIDHVLGQEVSLHKYKKVKITPCILAEHKRKKVRTQSKNKNKKTNPKEKSPKNHSKSTKQKTTENI
jgi:hypothetical protein